VGVNSGRVVEEDGGMVEVLEESGEAWGSVDEGGLTVELRGKRRDETEAKMWTRSQPRAKKGDMRREKPFEEVERARQSLGEGRDRRRAGREK